MRTSERKIVVQLHRKGQVFWTRRYARLDTAVPRITELLTTLNLKPRDVAEFSHINGHYIGCFRVKINGFVGEFGWWD